MSTPLLVVLPYCSKDVDAAEEVLLWISEIETPRAAGILLVADDLIPVDKMKVLADLARPTFNFVKTALVKISPGGWPANKMFLAAARQIEDQYRWPFFWMEPDCVPLTNDWLEQLENQYAECPKKFMGAIIEQKNQPNLPNRHLTGCAIYPQDCYELFRGIQAIQSGESAWDIGSAESVIPKADNTRLIQHYWGLPDLPPAFVKARDVDSPKNFLTLDFLKPEAVIFHRDKSHSLMPLLRERIEAGKQPLVPAK